MLATQLVVGLLAPNYCILSLWTIRGTAITVEQCDFTGQSALQMDHHQGLVVINVCERPIIIGEGPFHECNAQKIT